MNNLELITLSQEYKDEYINMIYENSHDLRQTGFFYRFPLSTPETFDDDVVKLNNRSKGIGLPEGKTPDSTYFLLDKDNNKIVGCINIRHRLDNYHFRRGGHIGYYICISDRNKGLAKIILKKGLDICRQLGIRDVLLTCLKDNIPSAKTIVANGGVFEKEVEDNGDTLQRYWIKVS